MKPEALRKKLEKLDEKHLETTWSKEELWGSIGSQLPQKKSKHRFFEVATRALPWAAIVLFTLGFFWLSRNGDEINVEVETIAYEDDVTDVFEADPELDEGKELIYETCRKQLEICESDQFKHLFEELQQLEEEKSGLLIMVEQYGSDEVAIKALIELENAESSITGKLISLIMT